MGYLPLSTSKGDRIFIAVVVFIALHFLWMRFMEPYLSLYVATSIGAVFGIVTVLWG